MIFTNTQNGKILILEIVLNVEDLLTHRLITTASCEFEVKETFEQILNKIGYTIPKSN